MTVTWGDVLYHSQVDHNFAFHTNAHADRDATALRQPGLLERSARAVVGRNEVAVRGADHAVALASAGSLWALRSCGGKAMSSGSRRGERGACTRLRGDGGQGEAGSHRSGRRHFTAAELAALGTLSPAVRCPAPGPDMSNRLADDAAAAAFGQKLFFETALLAGKLLEGDDDGSPGTLGVRRADRQGRVRGVPRARRRVISTTGSTGKQISLAAGWGRRRAPSLLDVGQARLLMWDGRHDALYNQPFGPLESPVEMNSSRLYAAEQIYARYRADYEAIFGPMPPLDDTARFPQLTGESERAASPPRRTRSRQCNGTTHGMPGDGAEFDGMAPGGPGLRSRAVVVNMGKALGAYERLLACGSGRFDAWMHGQVDRAFASEQRGAEIFVGRGKCVGCHSGPYLSDQKFHNVGLQPATVAVVFIDANDPGARDGLATAIADPLNVARHVQRRQRRATADACRPRP